MSNLKPIPVRPRAYVLEDGDTVGTAKSQYAKEYDVDYSNLRGKVIQGSGWRDNSPKVAVVIEEYK